MADKLMYITKDDTQYYPFCSVILVVGTFDTQLNKPYNHKSIIVPKVLYATNNVKFLHGFYYASLQIFIIMFFLFVVITI